MSSTVVILGSPRKGNSEAIAMAIADKAKAKGSEINVFKINQIKDAKGCQSCYGCKKSGKCVVKDGIADILEAVRGADNVILATPIYFGQPSAQYRMFEDRCFGYLAGDFSSNLPTGKKVVVITTCGSGLDGAKSVNAAMAGVWGGFFKEEVVGTIIAGNMMAPDAALNDKDVLAQIEEIGAKL